DIWLVQGDPGDSDKPTRFADHHDLDATVSNVSLGRVPNGDPTAQGASLFPTTSQSFGSANSPYVVGEVIISEVHYHQSVTGNPDIADGELEYVELYNTTGVTVDISEWELRQNDGGDFEMPAGAQIAASQTVVLVNFDPVVETAKATAFRTVHGIGGGVVLLGDENTNFGNLNNAGEELKLLAPEDPGNPASGFLLVDRVAYDDAAPWPTDADGAGDSLTRTL
ncbi:unnamed protein product, partial [marine sediment metagenome]